MSLMDLGIQSNSMGAFIKSWEHWMTLVTMVCALLLTYYLVAVPHKWFASTVAAAQDAANEAKAGMGNANLSSGVLGFDSVAGDSLLGRGGFAGRRVKAGMGAWEAPVFWNAGSYEDVNTAQTDGISGSDQMNAWSKNEQGYGAKAVYNTTGGGSAPINFTTAVAGMQNKFSEDVLLHKLNRP